MTDMSRRPTSDMCSGARMGVRRAGPPKGAFHVFAHFLEALFCGATPKRCSFVDDEKGRGRRISRLSRSRPMRADDHVHLARFQHRRESFLLGGAAERLSISMRAGNGGESFLERLKCWKVSTVVGARTATACCPMTVLNAARMATSVLP